MDPISDPDPDSDLDPAIFVLTFKTPTKNKFLNNKLFCSFLFEGTFASFFKYTKSKRSYKTVGIKVFLAIFA
jgi:hypothetical protein